MLPLIWRFLLSQYLKVTIFCVVAFVAVLLTTRLDDVAHFAALDATFGIVILFVIYQIPYILPIAIPVSCLISSILLVQRLSRSHELTALRSCGMAIRDFITPLLIAAAFLSVINFYVVSELATMSHLSTNLWKTELKSINPLLLLRNKHLLKLRGAYFDSLGASKKGESASQVVMAMPDKSSQRINILLADELRAKSDTLHTRGVTLLTTIKSPDTEGFDQLVIENIDSSQTLAQDFSQLMQHKAWKINNDYLKFPLLLSRLHEEKYLLKKAKVEGVPQGKQKAIQRNIYRCYSEIIRRVSVAVAAFTFTLMGIAFGISISRNRSNKSVFFVIVLAALFLVAYFTAKGIDHLIIASSLAYTVPHLIIVLFSIWMLRRVSKGIE